MLTLIVVIAADVCIFVCAICVHHHHWEWAVIFGFLAMQCFLAIAIGKNDDSDGKR
jgi:hypothetical protein